MESDVWIDRLQQVQLIALAGGIVLLLLLETLVPSRSRGWRDRFLHAVRNGGIWVVSVVTLSIVFGGTLVAAARWLEVHQVGALHFMTVPTWATFVIGIAALDFADYAFHRMSHQVRWLWLLHAVHHSDRDVDVTTNLRAHPLHLVVTSLTKLVVLAAIGVPLWLWLLRELIALPITQLHHAAVRLPPRLERLLGYVIVTPAMHRLHHAPDPQDNNANFGGMVPWWDWLFGTWRAPAQARSAGFGLPALDDASWQSVWGMCATPFRARRLASL